jgi:hypothetical protein
LNLFYRNSVRKSLWLLLPLQREGWAGRAAQKVKNGGVETARFEVVSFGGWWLDGGGLAGTWACPHHSP